MLDAAVLAVHVRVAWSYLAPLHVDIHVWTLQQSGTCIVPFLCFPASCACAAVLQVLNMALKNAIPDPPPAAGAARPAGARPAGAAARRQ